MKTYHTSFHDPCKVRVAVFDDGHNCAVVAGIDVVRVPRTLVLSVRKKVQARCGIAHEAILIGASHSHSSSPIGLVQTGKFDQANSMIRSLAYDKSLCADPKYLELVEKNLVDAICQAYNSRKESLSGVGTGIEDKVAFNKPLRDPTPLKSSFLSVNALYVPTQTRLEYGSETPSYAQRSRVVKNGIPVALSLKGRF